MDPSETTKASVRHGAGSLLVVAGLLGYLCSALLVFAAVWMTYESGLLGGHFPAWIVFVLTAPLTILSRFALSRGLALQGEEHEASRG